MAGILPQSTPSAFDFEGDLESERRNEQLQNAPRSDPTDFDPAFNSDIAREREENLQQTLQDQGDGAGDLVSQETGADGPTRGGDDTPRGTPRPLDQGADTSEYRARGEARVRALTDMFGEDALVLGHLLFEVPPLAIRIKKGNLTYRWKPLRTKESIAVKSGNGECYIEIDLAFVGLNQIQTSLAELIALWKKMPFCFIENVHIRRMIIPDSHNESMAVCLESLILDAVAGSPNAVYATLLLKWFNYKPYSKNFWFRREWRPAEGRRPQSNPDTHGPHGQREEGGTPSPEIGDLARHSVMVDLSSIDDPATIDALTDNMAPEVGLFESVQIDNPGDPTIDGTYPVVYPFNSEPFLDRVRNGGDSPVRISSWSDGLSMKWNTFVKVAVPRSWRYNNGTQEEIPLSVLRSRDRGSEEQLVENGDSSELWTVCGVEDGDSLWAFGSDPDTGERVVRNIRLIYTDSAETYNSYDDSRYNLLGIWPLPEGQDSYRPSNAKYGALAKEELIRVLGTPYGEGAQITIGANDWFGAGAYGRYLAVIHKGEININEHMIREGFSFGTTTEDEAASRPYLFALRDAMENHRGIWGQRAVDLENVPDEIPLSVRDHLTNLLNPVQWRRDYAPDVDGGHGGIPLGCAEESPSGYIMLNGVQVSTSFPVNHDLQFTVGEDGTGDRAEPLQGGVLHWTGAENPGNRVFSTLQTRNLSVHFALDADGTLWQFADPGRTYTLNAGESLGRITWAIEITSYGRGSPPGGGEERDRYETEIHGTTYTVADFYSAQYDTLFELCNLIHTTLSLPKVSYTDPTELVPWARLRTLGGVIGHYHASSGKKDPGTRVFDRLAAQPGWSTGFI